MAGFLAYVLPVGGTPDNSLPGGGGMPDNSLPGWSGGPVDPGYGRPGGPYPGNRPPGSWGGRPDNSLPGQPLPPHISNRPPGSGGGRPDNSLPGGGYPSGQPIPPGVATPYGVAAATAPPASVDTAKGAWVLVALGDGVVVWAWAQPQNVGGGGTPDNTLPPGKPPTAGTPLPPTPAPKA
jgi:hypothetical protein